MKIICNRFFSTMAILILLEPGYFHEVEWLDNIFDIGKIIVVVILLVTFLRQKKRHISNVTFAIVLLSLWYLIVSLSRNLDVRSVILETGYVLSFLLLTEIMISFDARIFVDAITTVLTFLIVANFVSFILFPEGMYNNGIFSNCWLLGYKNASIQYVLADLFFLKLKGEYTLKKRVHIETMLVYIAGLLFAIAADSMTSTFALVLYAVLKIVMECVRMEISLIPFIAVNYLVAFWLTYGNMFTFTKDIVYRLTGRQSTWEVRKLLWIKIIHYVNEHPIMGNGVLNSSDFAMKMGRTWMAHAHNTYLQVLYQGGVVAILIFISVFIYASKKVQGSNLNIYRAFFVVILIFLLIFQSEYYAKIYLIYAILLFGARMKECNFAKKECSKRIVIKFHKNIC